MSIDQPRGGHLCRDHGKIRAKSNWPLGLVLGRMRSSLLHLGDVPHARQSGLDKLV